MSESEALASEEIPPPGSSHSRLILLFSLPLAAALLYLSVRKANWHEVMQAIARCRLSLLFATLLISTTSYFLRGLRWRILLNTQEHLPMWRVFWANSAGYLGNNVLPARAGEFIRTAMVSTQSSLSKTFVLTTALAERLMDAIVLVIAGTAILRLVPNKPDWLARLSTPLLLLACAAAAVIISVPLFEALGQRLVKKLPISPRLQTRLEDAVEHIAAGVRSFHDPARFAWFLLLTFAIWSLDAYSCVVLGIALDLHLGIEVALLLIVGIAMGSALPSTPGYIGIFQFVAVTVLMPFGFTRSQAIAYILVTQACALVVTGMLGVIGLLQYRRMKSAVSTG